MKNETKNKIKIKKIKNESENEERIWKNKLKWK